MKFNWMSIVGILPALIIGIQQIHTDAKGADKKQIALESMGLATAAADVILPPEQKAIADATSGMIDQFVNLFHATNAPGFGANAPKA